MKKPILLLVAFFLCLSFVYALPVTYMGEVNVDGQITATNIPVKIITDLENTEKEFDGNYSINIAGTKGTTTKFYIYGVLVDTYVQPDQTSIIINNLQFNDSFRLDEEDDCGYNDACLSENCNSGHCCPDEMVWCSTSCKSSCSTGGGGFGVYYGPTNTTTTTTSTTTTTLIDSVDIPRDQQLLNLINLLRQYYKGDGGLSLDNILKQLVKFYKGESI